MSVRNLTPWPSLRTDIRNRAWNWVDEQVKVCHGGPNTLVTSRKSDDLKAFREAQVHEFGRATT